MQQTSKTPPDSGPPDSGPPDSGTEAKGHPDHGRDRTEEQLKKDTCDILQKIGMYDRRDHLPRELSGGQQQRVSIARAIVNKPDILFADEPCANLDTENSRMVLDLFREINEEMQQTIVMVSHEDWHKEYFHRIVRLRDGKVISDGTDGLKPR